MIVCSFVFIGIIIDKRKLVDISGFLFNDIDIAIQKNNIFNDDILNVNVYSHCGYEYGYTIITLVNGDVYFGDKHTEYFCLSSSMVEKLEQSDIYDEDIMFHGSIKKCGIILTSHLYTRSQKVDKKNILYRKYHSKCNNATKR